MIYVGRIEAGCVCIYRVSARRFPDEMSPSASCDRFEFLRFNIGSTKTKLQAAAFVLDAKNGKIDSRAAIFLTGI